MIFLNNHICNLGVQMSTTMCTFIINKNISYYINIGSTVHVLLFEASKTFNRVNYCLLFQEYVPISCKDFTLHVYKPKTTH